MHFCRTESKNNVLYRYKKYQERKSFLKDELVLQCSDRSEYTLFRHRTSNTAPFRQKQLK